MIRIGVIDREDGSITRGAQLAARHINEAGGIVGADGTAFTVSIAASPAEHMDIAIGNMGQAGVAAVLAPGSNAIMREYMSALRGLNVPILTSASSDSLLVLDDSGLFFRSQAPDSVRSQVLAAYLVNTLGISNIFSIQLDSESTSSLIAFASELSGFGAGISNLLVDEAQFNLSGVAAQVIEGEAEAVALFGPPLMAAQAYSQLRASGYDGLVSYRHAEDIGFVSFVPADSLPGIVIPSAWSYAAGDSQSQAFILAYLREYGAVPNAEAASSYDAVGLLAQAFRQPGQLADNLAKIAGYTGLQGRLYPASLARGETSDNVMITELNEHGAPIILAHFHEGEQSTVEQSQITRAVSAPEPSPTPSGYSLITKSAYQNVRSGPGLNYDILGQLPQGTQARVIGASADFSWLVIEFREQWGWLAAYLVETYGNRGLVPIIQPPPTPAPQATATIAAPSHADLVVIHAYPERITLGQQTTVNVTVMNRGLAAAGPFAIAATFQPGGQYAGVNLPGLASGQQATAQLQLSLNGATGRQSATIVADLNNQVYEGEAGEANNQSFAFNYIADRELINSGSWTSAAGSLDLDGDGNADATWTGSDLFTVSGGMYLMSAYSSYNDAHYEAISPELATVSGLSAEQLSNALVGIVSGNGRRAVAQVIDVSRNGSLSLAYRVYR